MIFLFDIAVTYNFNRTLEFLFSLHECLRVHGSLCLRLLLLIFNFIPQNRLPNHKQYCSIWKWRAFKICDFKFVAKKRDERGRGFLFRRVFAYKIEFWEVGYLMRSSYKHVVDYLRYFSSSRGGRSRWTANWKKQQELRIERGQPKRTLATSSTRLCGGLCRYGHICSQVFRKDDTVPSVAELSVTCVVLLGKLKALIFILNYLYAWAPSIPIEKSALLVNHT